MVKKTRKLRGGESTSISKQDVLKDPMVKEALKSFIAQQGGGAIMMKMKGSGWWDDFTGFLKRNKVISVGSKIGQAVANASGYLPLGKALGAISVGSSALGYGRRTRGGEYAQSIAMPSSSSATPFLKF